MKTNVVVLLAFLTAICSPAGAETLLVGPAGTPGSLLQALQAAKDGDVIELLAGDYKAEVAVLPAKRLTLRGVPGKRPVVSAAGKAAEGKAIWIVRGGDITVDNIEFRGARASDADGAGIRLDSGRLTVSNSAFFDNEHGILTGNDESAELVVENSLFAQAPKVVGGLSHLLYVGRIGKFSVTGSRFHQGFEGHMIKSRARESRIAYNLINDGAEGESSHEIDLPNGGQAWVIGNVIGQSKTSQNPVLVAFGGEGRAWEQSTLVMAHNTLVNEHWMPAWFLRVFRDRLPESAEVVAVNNLTIGLGVFEWGARGRFEGNSSALSNSIVDAETMAFELVPHSWMRGRGADPRRVAGHDLSPTAEFTMPIGSRPIAAPTSWSPGAFQK